MPETRQVPGRDMVMESALAGDGEGVVRTFDAVVDRRGMGAAYDVGVAPRRRDGRRESCRGPWRLEFPDIDDASYDKRRGWPVSSAPT